MKAGARVRSWVPKRMVPELTASMPVMRLMSVVLPAPFGPISPVILPLGTCMLTSDTAATPPKCLDRFSIASVVIQKPSCCALRHSPWERPGGS